LRLVLLLQANGQLTARELASRLEVSTRTIQRDLDSLSVSGVPVYSTRGRGGGWTLARDYKVNLGGLTPAEATGVFVGRNLQMLTDLGLKDATDTALMKLLAALPAHSRQDAEHARQRVYVDHTDWKGVDAESAEFLDVLHHGLWNEYRIRLTYGSRADAFEVAPLGLVAKHRTWYLVALRDGDVRTYKVSRITGAEATDTGFERPKDFDLPTYWHESWRRYLKQRRVYRVRLLVRPGAVHRLTWAPNIELTSVADPVDGWSDVAMRFENAVEAEMFLLGMGADAIVLEPAELRTSIRAAAAETARQHTD
jgi:predicted DNA-binding transcriptional regulator YafY